MCTEAVACGCMSRAPDSQVFPNFITNPAILLSWFTPLEPVDKFTLSEKEHETRDVEWHRTIEIKQLHVHQIRTLRGGGRDHLYRPTKLKDIIRKDTTFPPNNSFVPWNIAHETPYYKRGKRVWCLWFFKRFLDNYYEKNRITYIIHW